jgi:hypothetical protein
LILLDVFMKHFFMTLFLPSPLRSSPFLVRTKFPSRVIHTPSNNRLLLSVAAEVDVVKPLRKGIERGGVLDKSDSRIDSQSPEHI